MKKDMGRLLKKWGFERPVQGMHVRRIGRHQYEVDSETRPEIAHHVDTEGDFPECSCENHTIAQNISCKHIRRVGLLIEAGILPNEKKHEH